ncbi:MAG TPA: hypothetical protein VIK62_00655 [Verrucomicrobiae bacterium]
MTTYFDCEATRDAFEPTSFAFEPKPFAFESTCFAFGSTPDAFRAKSFAARPFYAVNTAGSLIMGQTVHKNFISMPQATT